MIDTCLACSSSLSIIMCTIDIHVGHRHCNLVITCQFKESNSKLRFAKLLERRSRLATLVQDNIPLKYEGTLKLMFALTCLFQMQANRRQMQSMCTQSRSSSLHSCTFGRCKGQKQWRCGPQPQTGRTLPQELRQLLLLEAPPLHQRTLLWKH